MGGKYRAAQYLINSSRHLIDTRTTKSLWRNSSRVETGRIDQNGGWLSRVVAILRILLLTTCLDQDNYYTCSRSRSIYKFAPPPLTALIR